MDNFIFELSSEEIELISGGADIDPPAQASPLASADGFEIPQIDNNPP